MTVQKLRSSVQWRSLVGCVLVGALMPGVAQAQPGDHVRIGDAELVPKLVLGSHYRTNAYLMESDEEAGVGLMLRPSAELELDGQDLDVGLGAAYHLRKYLNPQLSNLDRYRDGHFDLALGILPSSGIGFELEA